MYAGKEKKSIVFIKKLIKGRGRPKHSGGNWYFFIFFFNLIFYRGRTQRMKKGKQKRRRKGKIRIQSVK